jgi:hypothetical protein
MTNEEKPKPMGRVPKGRQIAAFVSRKKGLKLWIKGPDVQVIPAVGRVIRQGTGHCIQFVNHKFQTSERKEIDHLLNHKGFSGNNGNDFFPDPADPTGFWLKKGFYKEEMVKARVAVDPRAIEQEGKAQADAVANELAKVAAREHSQTKTETLRTSVG